MRRTGTHGAAGAPRGLPGRRLAALTILAVAGATGSGCGASQPARCSAGGCRPTPAALLGPRCPTPAWVGTWSASPSDALSEGYRDQTLRVMLTPHLGGASLRVRLSNRFGTRRLTIDDARVARQGDGAALAPGTSRRLSFEGATTVAIAPGAEALSDPAPLSFSPFQTMAVDLHVRGATGPGTEHHTARQLSYVAPADGRDHAGEPGAAPFTSTATSWPLVDGVEVPGGETAGTVVAVGDSITDGVSSGPVAPTGDSRYPDELGRVMLARPGRLRFAVLNAGIDGNRVLRDGPSSAAGPSLLHRLQTDVLALPDVTDVIVLEGINDIGQSPRPRPGELEAGLEEVVRRLHAHGVNVLLGTLTPARGAQGPSYGSAAADAERRAVNAWIRSSRVPDGVVDFDAALRDPAEPARLDPRFDSGDHIHPNAGGYRAMAEAVDLTLLAGRRCAVRRPAPRAGSGSRGDRAHA